MPSSLTSTKIKDTYGQILHVDGGVNGTPKTVYDGDGTATALKVGTGDVQVNNSPVLTDADAASFATAAQGSKADTAVQPAAIANMLETSDIGVTVQGYDSTILKSSAIGTTVQAYDADLTTWAGKTAPTGTVVGTSDTQTLTGKTINLSNNTLVATSAQLAAAVTDETGTGALLFANSPAMTGTPTEGGFRLVVASDIGTAPNEIPINGYLGDLAFQSSNALVVKPAASVTPAGIGDMVFQLTNDTTLVVKVKGSDGTVRSATLTLA